MDIGLGWLSDLMRWASRIFPRGLHVDKTQEGVMFTLGRAKPIGPGFHLYWPPIQRPMVHPVKRDTLNLEPQTLPYGSTDPIGLTISVTVVYTICDIEKALIETYDFMETIKDRAQAGVIEACIGKTIDELMRRHQGINSAITKKIRKALEPFGVDVEVAFMSDFHLTSMFRVHGGMSILPMQGPNDVEEEDGSV
jgi:regulator of protease activity HflC (stomatin/prohibitin superfamily)